MLTNAMRLLLMGVIIAGLSACNLRKKQTDPDQEANVNTEESTRRGLALYTIREEMENDPRGTLAEVARIGYQAIEAAGYKDGLFYGMEPGEFRAYLDSLGIEPLSTHMSEITLDNADTFIEDSKEAGFRYLVVPVPPMGHFTYSPEKGMGMSSEVETVADIINQLGKKCRDAGIQLLYHNHDFEFLANENGVVPMDYFIKHTDPDAVKFELDLYWITRAGQDPARYFQMAPGRFVAWHVKDMDSLGRFAPVGKGTIDFKALVELREHSGMKLFFVEQDQTFEQNPMEAIEISYGNLPGIGL